MNPKRESSGTKKTATSFAPRPNLRVVRSVSWSDIGDSDIADLVRCASEHGAAIMFGRTADGGALSLCVLDNDQKIKEYPRSGDDVEAFRMWLKFEYFGDGGKPAA